jgi:cell division protein FtsN
VTERPTHYQLSFTTRQALGVFVVLLFALGLAYFFGLMTGLAGRSREEIASVAPTPSPAPTPLTIPAPELGVRMRRGGASRTEIAERRDRPTPVPSPEPTGSATLQLFEDGGAPEPTVAPVRQAVRAEPSTRETARGFWVQVLSVSSEREAKSRSARLRQHRFHTAIVPGKARGGTVYRVRVGPYASREEAARAAARLEKQEKVKPWIVPAGQ